MDTSRFEKLLRDEKTKLEAEQKENAKEDELAILNKIEKYQF